jgi:hypothetical protein
MNCNPMLFKFARALLLSMCLLSLDQICAAQFERAPTPLADPADTRFQGATEDVATPSLSTSHLISVPPMRASLSRPKDSYTVDLVRVQWRWGDPIDLYVMKPKGVQNPPVILTLFGYPSDTDTFRDPAFQEGLTKEGFAAVGFVSALTGQRYHDRPMKEWLLSELQESLATSAHDVQMVLNYLDARGDLDMSRVGMFGQGSGATIAILASGVDPRIKALDVMDPWGDWPTWLAESRFPPEDERANFLKPEFLKKAAAFETLNWMPKIQAKRVRFQQNLYESDTPVKVKEELRAAVPPGTTVVLYKNAKELDAAFPGTANLTGWLKQALQKAPASQVAGSVEASPRR